MSDFFSLLSRRALQPAAIRPRLPSRFEGDSALPISTPSEREESFSASPERPQSPVLSVPPTVVSAPAELRPPAPLMAAEPQVAALLPSPGEPQPWPASTDLPERLAPSAAVPVAPQWPVPERLDLPSPPEVASAQVVLAAQAVAPLREPPVIEPLSLPIQSPAPAMSDERLPVHELRREVIEQRVERLLPAVPFPVSGPSQLAPASAMPMREPQALTAARTEAGPRVEINIGRIEILSSEAPRSPRREEQPARPSALSLDAYLSERSKPARGGRP